MVFSKNTKKNFWGGGKPPPRPFPQRGGGIPSTPLGACGTSTPPILKFSVRQWPTVCGFWQYKSYADIHRGSLVRWCQMKSAVVKNGSFVCRSLYLLY